VLVGALGFVPIVACVFVGCSRTDPLDYEPVVPARSRDAGMREARSDAPHDRPLPVDVVRDLGVPDRGPPDVKPDVPSGCTSDAECDDGIACTLDRCDLATGVCSHSPVDTSCAPGFACFPGTGCGLGSFANDFTTVYSVVLPAGTVAAIGATGPKFYDVALHPNGTLYAITEGALYTIDTSTAHATMVAPVDRELDGLDFGGDGTLYAAAPATTDVYTMDTVSGALTVIANLPEPYSCSGDVAVLGTTLFVTATDGSGTLPDVLMSIDLTATPLAVTTVGSTGQSSVFGLAAYEGVLYGFTFAGDVLGIDTATGSSTVLAKPGNTFYGATAR
jgi:hypothetical protein